MTNEMTLREIADFSGMSMTSVRRRIHLLRIEPCGIRRLPSGSGRILLYSEADARRIKAVPLAPFGNSK